ncbi:hypothetical protein BO78DRAFT_415796 [Aspergillus sclerotiicarbonarius CBS 121057]|uniref:Uncharacterized protein n=1 Tax=Aspergillus sclerotiicarbonarius (strain CBS 121057 / IBT 28362) TaxID=1448318 RepID=A0A319EGP9_ASPSB|nr:hypothetical protein BO78DRAFT_415796 [Aspergillus sclerotiicarbonarius CBS 121057]
MNDLHPSNLASLKPLGLLLEVRETFVETITQLRQLLVASLDPRDAERYLQQEYDAWTGKAQERWLAGAAKEQEERNPPLSLLRKRKVKFPVGALSDKYWNEDLQQAVKPASRFWLFPITSLGASQEDIAREEQPLDLARLGFVPLAINLTPPSPLGLRVQLPGSVYLRKTAKANSSTTVRCELVTGDPWPAQYPLWPQAPALRWDLNPHNAWDFSI